LDGEMETQWVNDVDLVQVIHDAVEQIRPQAEKKSVALETSSDDKDVIVPGNALQLQRAIVNILTNAVNYTPESGVVQVSTNILPSNMVAVKIVDSGIGIEAADLPHIFERFYRADKSRTRAAATGGTGLGLAITQEIVNRHHGKIDVESTFGKGSTFTITLPRKSDHTQTA
jgi:signal transduction histidine kinase